MKVPRLARRWGRGPSCQPWPIWSPVSSPLPRHPVQCWCLFIKLWRNVGWQIIKDHFMAWITWYNLFRLLAFVWYQKWSQMWNYHFYANNLLDVKMRGNCRMQRLDRRHSSQQSCACSENQFQNGKLSACVEIFRLQYVLDAGFYCYVMLEQFSPRPLVRPGIIHPMSRPSERTRGNFLHFSHAYYKTKLTDNSLAAWLLAG